MTPARPDRTLTPHHWEPRAHVTAERNWLNDPNGPVHHDGRYHLFFQANHAAMVWGPPSWGHVSSADLVTWQRHPAALEPEPDGPDSEGCWSGCLRVVDGVPTIYYTGVVGEGDEDRVESICRATSTDAELHTWTKDPANPLVPGPPPGHPSGYHRDPFLWQNERGWHLLVGSGVLGEHRYGTVLVYHSPDAARWEYGGVFLSGADDPDGTLGVHWECPQLVRFADGWVLILSIQDHDAENPLSHVAYLVGDITDDRFVPRSVACLDHGDTAYAPAVTTDSHGRVLMWAWAQDHGLVGSVELPGTSGALTLPRELTLVGDQLLQRLPSELVGLRSRALVAARSLAAGDRLVEPGPDQPAVEVLLRASGTDGSVRLQLSSAGGELAGGEVAFGELSVEADLQERTVTVRIDGASTVVPAPTVGAEIEIRLLRDGSLVELLVDGASLTTRWYGGAGQGDVVIRLDGDDVSATLDGVWALATDVVVPAVSRVVGGVGG